MKLLIAVPLVLVQLSCVHSKPKPEPVDLCLSSPQSYNNELECQTQDIKK